MWKLCLAALAFLALLRSPVLATTTTAAPLVTATDEQFRADAGVAADLWCGSYTGGEVAEEEGRQALVDGVGGNNIILEALEESEDSGAVASNMQSKLQGNTALYMKGFPIVAAILLSLVWLVMCCTACPHKKCACCRCCRRSWECNIKIKGVALLALACLFLGICIALGMAAQGTAAANDGVAGLACSAANLINSSYAGGGSGNTKFIGILPTLQEFQSLKDKLNDGSTFVNRINAEIDATVAIDNAVMVAAQTLQLLKDSLENTANSQPKNNNGDALVHNQRLSEPSGLPALLTPVIQALNTGVASSLVSARAAAKEQLNTENRREIQSQLDNAINPLKDAKDTLRSTFQNVVDPDLRDQFESTAESGLLGAVTGLFMWAFLALCCGCGSLGCCIKKEKENNSIHRMACCTWCCGFYLAIVAMFVGGLLLIIAVPLSSVCLILADVNREMLNNIGDAISFNMTGDMGVMMGDMVEQCFNPPDASVPASLMDILFERNETSGQKVTLRDRFITEFKDKLDNEFNAVTASLNLNMPALAADPRMIALRNALLDNPASQMLSPDLSGNDYAALSSVTALQEAAQNSSGSCSSSYSPLLGNWIGGIDEFRTQLEAVGAQPASSSAIPNGLSCTVEVVCTGGSDVAACNAGNLLMYKKAALQSNGAFDSSTGGTASTNTYKCLYFNRAGQCDVKNMLAYTDDQMCLNDNSGVYSMAQMETSCNLATFTLYLQDFSQRIDKVLTLVDDVTDVALTKINVTMRQILDEEIMVPLDQMANSMNCNFLGQLYGDVVDAFCFQGMWGFRRIAVSYTTLGFFQILLIPLMYSVYRVGRDKLDLGGASQEAAAASLAEDASQEGNFDEQLSI